jgi:hypothetical protein
LVTEGHELNRVKCQIGAFVIADCLMAKKELVSLRHGIRLGRWQPALVQLLADKLGDFCNAPVLHSIPNPWIRVRFSGERVVTALRVLHFRVQGSAVAQCRCQKYSFSSHLIVAVSDI